MMHVTHAQPENAKNNHTPCGRHKSNPTKLPPGNMPSGDTDNRSTIGEKNIRARFDSPLFLALVFTYTKMIYNYIDKQIDSHLERINYHLLRIRQLNKYEDNLNEKL